MLVEGSSLRSVSRVTGLAYNTVLKLVSDSGRACLSFHDQHVRNIQASDVQCDELWGFCYSKARTTPTTPPEAYGDVWTWVALDSRTKLVISWLLTQNRDTQAASQFISDLRSRISLGSRIQLTTDGFRSYFEAIERAFGSDVDYAQLIKIYSQNPDQERRYSPTRFVASRKVPVSGNPDNSKISTSYVERHNLTTRMSVRRLTRLTNAFSKKFQNHQHALSLYFCWYNFCRIHKTLGVTPGQASQLFSFPLDLSEIVSENLPKPNRPKSYRQA